MIEIRPILHHLPGHVNPPSLLRSNYLHNFWRKLFVHKRAIPCGWLEASIDGDLCHYPHLARRADKFRLMPYPRAHATDGSKTKKSALSPWIFMKVCCPKYPWDADSIHQHGIARLRTLCKRQKYWAWLEPLWAKDLTHTDFTCLLWVDKLLKFWTWTDIIKVSIGFHTSYIYIFS